MTLSSKDIDQLCAIAERAAVEAGDFIASSTSQSVKRKGGDTTQPRGGLSLASQVVTEIDVKAQEIILAVLAPSIEMYDLAILTEEEVDDRSRFDKDFFWCIDPLDGTLPFIEGKPGYCVSIALVAKEGTSILGVVYDPSRRLLYSAKAGQGAFVNKIPIQVPAEELTTLHMIIDRSFLDHPWFAEGREALHKLSHALGYDSFEVIQFGGAVLNAVHVLEKGNAFYLKLPKPERGGGSSWDFAASACLFHEVGAPATDVYGVPLDLNRVDDTFMNHKGVLFASSQGLAKEIRTFLNGKLK